MKNRAGRHRLYLDRPMCEEWNSFDAFYNWAISNGYSDDLTLDRIDNNLGYSPENCRWTTYKVQENNRSNNRMVTIHGETHTLAEWADKIGVSRATLANRIASGWPDDDLFLPPNLANRVIRGKIHA